MSDIRYRSEQTLREQLVYWKHKRQQAAGHIPAIEYELQRRKEIGQIVEDASRGKAPCTDFILVNYRAPKSRRESPWNA